MLPLALTELDAAYYVGNLHKWVCAPKGAAFLWARADHQDELHPNVISHGLAAPGPRPQLWKEFDWTGSDDPSAWLVAPDAIDFIAGLCPGGWPEVRRKNRELALAARALLSSALGAEPLAPESMLESLVAIPLPDGSPTDSPNPDDNPLHLRLYARHRIQVPVFCWPRPPQRHFRVAAHIYNELWEYERLASALREELGI
jgi:isopenicillin-N epimerase